MTFSLFKGFLGSNCFRTSTSCPSTLTRQPNMTRTLGARSCTSSRKTKCKLHMSSVMCRPTAFPNACIFVGCVASDGNNVISDHVDSDSYMRSRMNIKWSFSLV